MDRWLLIRILEQMTSFGELFDQEVDNFLILVLTFSLIQILTIVFLSYVFLCIDIYF